jgi:hypothetical protein
VGFASVCVGSFMVARRKRCRFCLASLTVQVEHVDTKAAAAAKVIPLDSDDDIEDFLVEVRTQPVLDPTLSSGWGSQDIDPGHIFPHTATD